MFGGADFVAVQLGQKARAMQNLRAKIFRDGLPQSASVDRAPKFTPAPRAGEYARIGTYSREWSVVSQRGSGSQP